MEYLTKLLREKGGTPGFYAEVQKHLTTFTRQHIVSKCRQLSKTTTDLPTTSQATPVMSDLNLSGLNKTLPPPSPTNEARRILDETLSSKVKAGHISPMAVDPKVIYSCVKKMIRTMTKKKVKPTSRWRKPLPLKHSKRDKRTCNKSLQDQYKKDRSGAARWLLDGKIRTTCPIDPVATERAYKNIWEAKDDFRGLGQFGLLPETNNGFLYGPITPVEVVTTMKQTKQNETNRSSRP